MILLYSSLSTSSCTPCYKDDLTARVPPTSSTSRLGAAAPERAAVLGEAASSASCCNSWNRSWVAAVLKLTSSTQKSWGQLT